jgi:hypothetical protein
LLQAVLLELTKSVGYNPAFGAFVRDRKMFLMKEGFRSIELKLWEENAKEAAKRVRILAQKRWYGFSRQVRDTYLNTRNYVYKHVGPPFTLYDKDPQDADGLARLAEIKDNLITSIRTITGDKCTFSHGSQPSTFQAKISLVKKPYRLKYQTFNTEIRAQYSRLLHVLTDAGKLKVLMVMAQQWKDNRNPVLVPQTDTELKNLVRLTMAGNSISFWRVADNR